MEGAPLVSPGDRNDLVSPHHPGSYGEKGCRNIRRAPSCRDYMRRFARFLSIYRLQFGVIAAVGIVPAVITALPKSWSSGGDGSEWNFERKDSEEMQQSRSLLSWEEAGAKAFRATALMTDLECAQLISGQGFLSVGSWVGVMRGIPRLGIPDLMLQDASAGFRPTGPNEYGTVTSWPSMLSLAASWDESVVFRVARVIAREFRGKGANVLLGPGLNVHRSPYGGRNWEYLSGEDAYLGSRFGAAYVRAVQGEGVMAVIKHFAFNEQETERNSEDSIVGKKTAAELYLAPFQAAIEAGAGAVMCSYNRFNGTHACGSELLLTKILREQLGFSGFVMSDWSAVTDTHSIVSGTDMEQPDAKHFSYNALLHHGYVPAAREAARRILSSIYHLRLDEFPVCDLPCNEKRSSNQRTPEHLNLAEDAAKRSVVLLKNDGTLPLVSGRVRTIAVIGVAATAVDTQNVWGPGSPYSGGGSGHVAAPDVVTPLEGIRRRAKAAGITVLTQMDEVNHTSGQQPVENVSRRLQDVAVLAEEADVVIVVGAATATESVDRTSLGLDDGADALIFQVAKLKNTIVLLEVPGPVFTPWRNEVSAIACLFLGGERTGNAWAATLFGDVAPSGKLPVTMPASAEALVLPGHTAVHYDEGLATSYRAPGTFAYPFGHGLTYTQFSVSTPLSVMKVDSCQSLVCIKFNVTNVGRKVGSEVVQAYAQFKRGNHEPNMVLRGFYRTANLLPGQHEEVLMQFTEKDFSVFTPGDGWVPQTSVGLLIGTSSADIHHRLSLNDLPIENFASRLSTICFFLPFLSSCRNSHG